MGRRRQKWELPRIRIEAEAVGEGVRLNEGGLVGRMCQRAMPGVGSLEEKKIQVEKKTGMIFYMPLNLFASRSRFDLV